RRDATSLRPAEETVKYRIRALMKPRAGLKPVPAPPEKTYQGEPFPLAYLDGGVETNEVTVTATHGKVRAAFTNGILSAQWLKRALEDNGEKLSADAVRRHIEKPGDKIRTYLTGDVLDTLKELLARAAAEPGSQVLLALYELGDKELIDALLAARD